VEEASNSNIKLYPNPAHDFIFVGTNLFEAQYSILNSIGEEAHTGRLKDDSQIDIRHLASGIYFFRIDEMAAVFVKE
jgi:hypothetical protein